MTEQRYCVEVAHTGPDGQHYALQHEYDLIILDVMLPGADGFSVLRAIRAAKQTPVIMLTARDRVDDRVKGRSEEHTSELQSLMHISYADFCLKKKKPNTTKKYKQPIITLSVHSNRH